MAAETWRRWRHCSHRTVDALKSPRHGSSVYVPSAQSVNDAPSRPRPGQTSSSSYGCANAQIRVLFRPAIFQQATGDSRITFRWSYAGFLDMLFMRGRASSKIQHRLPGLPFQIMNSQKSWIERHWNRRRNDAAIGEPIVGFGNSRRLRLHRADIARDGEIDVVIAP